ncbi:efflux RND transporter periplasmic adaptor subunit [Halomonas sp. BLK-85]
MKILFLTFILAALLLLTACFSDAPSSKETDSDTPNVTVAVLKGWRGEVSQKLPGVVRPGKRAALSTRFAGTLLTVEVEPGDRVTSGDLLASVDAREVTAAIAATRSKINATQASVEQARLESQRLERLYAEDLIARVRMERAQVKYEELQAQLQAAESELETQQANLSYTRLTAPFNGRVTETPVDAGSFVGPGQPLVIMESRGQLRVDVPVSSQVASRLKSGEPLSVIIGPEDKRLPATLTSVVPALGEEATGQRLRLRLEAADDLLSPGQVVSVLVPDRAQQTQSSQWVGLPRAALLRRGQLTGTLVVEQASSGPALRLEWIRIANPPANNSELIPVTQGLAVGDRVVLNPSPRLEDGQAVTIKPSGSQHAGE